MVWLHERFDGGLPVAIEDHPLAPLVAHLLHFERVEEAGSGLEVFAQRHAVGVHVDEHPATPGIDPDFAQVRALICERALPIRLIELEGALAIQVIAPAMEPADKLFLVATGAMRAFAGSYELAAPVRANIVVGLDGL